MSRIPSLISLVFLCSLFSTSTVSQEARDLLGQWRLEAAPVEVPEQCFGNVTSFNEDGSSLFQDGEQILVSSYRVVKVANGLVVETAYVSDNNRPNCQGLSAAFKREHLVERILVKFFDGTNKIRMYLGESEEAPFFIAVRVK